MQVAFTSTHACHKQMCTYATIQQNKKIPMALMLMLDEMLPRAMHNCFLTRLLEGFCAEIDTGLQKLNEYDFYTLSQNNRGNTMCADTG